MRLRVKSKPGLTTGSLSNNLHAALAMSIADGVRLTANDENCYDKDVALTLGAGESKIAYTGLAEGYDFIVTTEMAGKPQYVNICRLDTLWRNMLY